MQLVEALSALKSLKAGVFQTSDAAACLAVSGGHASQILRRLTANKLIVSLRRGLWAISEKVDPFAVAEDLVLPFPSYLSCQTALYFHNMIDQIPQTIYSVTLARSQKYDTPLGHYSYHHISPTFFFGFEIIGAKKIKIATPEKALLDFFYLHSSRSGLFRALPEVELPPRFAKGKVQKMINEIPQQKIRTMVQEQWDKFRSPLVDRCEL